MNLITLAATGLAALTVPFAAPWLAQDGPCTNTTGPAVGAQTSSCEQSCESATCDEPAADSVVLLRTNAARVLGSNPTDGQAASSTAALAPRVVRFEASDDEAAARQEAANLQSEIAALQARLSSLEALQASLDPQLERTLDEATRITQEARFAALDQELRSVDARRAASESERRTVETLIAATKARPDQDLEGYLEFLRQDAVAIDNEARELENVQRDLLVAMGEGANLGDFFVELREYADETLPAPRSRGQQGRRGGSGNISWFVEDEDENDEYVELELAYAEELEGYERESQRLEKRAERLEKRLAKAMEKGRDDQIEDLEDELADLHEELEELHYERLDIANELSELLHEHHEMRWMDALGDEEHDEYRWRESFGDDEDEWVEHGSDDELEWYDLFALMGEEDDDDFGHWDEYDYDGDEHGDEYHEMEWLFEDGGERHWPEMPRHEAATGGGGHTIHAGGDVSIGGGDRDAEIIQLLREIRDEVRGLRDDLGEIRATPAGRGRSSIGATPTPPSFPSTSFGLGASSPDAPWPSAARTGPSTLRGSASGPAAPSAPSGLATVPNPFAGFAPPAPVAPPLATVPAAPTAPRRAH